MSFVPGSSIISVSVLKDSNRTARFKLKIEDAYSAPSTKKNEIFTIMPSGYILRHTNPSFCIPNPVHFHLSSNFTPTVSTSFFIDLLHLT